MRVKNNKAMKIETNQKKVIVVMIQSYYNKELKKVSWVRNARYIGTHFKVFLY